MNNGMMLDGMIEGVVTFEGFREGCLAVVFNHPHVGEMRRVFVVDAARLGGEVAGAACVVRMAGGEAWVERITLSSGTNALPVEPQEQCGSPGSSPAGQDGGPPLMAKG